MDGAPGCWAGREWLRLVFMPAHACEIFHKRFLGNKGHMSTSTTLLEGCITTLG